MTTATVQLPVLFDVSGTATVFGESATTADFITPHLSFTLDMTTEANDISFNAAHISGAIAVGDHEISDTIYYAQNLTGGSVDLLANRIAKAITRGKLVHLAATTTHASGDHADSGIPMGGRSLVLAGGTGSGTYALKYRTSIAPAGDEQMMGEAMARVAAVHLVGHPLAQAVFKNEGTIQTDLEVASGTTFTVNGSNTAFYNSFATQLSKVLGGTLCSTPLKTAVLDPSGQVGQAIFEGSALVDAKDANSEGIIVAVPDVSGNDASTKALGSGDIAVGASGGPADKPLYVHDLSATSFQGSPNVKSMTFWLRTSGVDASVNIVDNQTIFHAVNLPGPKNLKLRLRNANSNNDRLAISDDNTAATQLAAIQMNEVARTGSHAATYQLAPAVTKAEISVGNVTTGGKWNFFYVEFAAGFYPKEIAWMSDSAATRANSMLGSHVDEIHYFGSALTASEITAMRTFRTSQIKSNGLELPAVKSMFEQLMNIPGRALDMDSAIEVTGLGAEGARTSTVGMPIKAGDKVVVYIRPKVEFAFETVDITASNLLGFTGTTLDVSSGNVKDISGLVTAGATASTISAVFPGRAAAGQAAEANTYGWMGSPNATMIGIESTNITDVNTMDQHIWKIEISL
jgi:hypothetical protein